MEYQELESLWNNTGTSIETNASLNKKMIKELTYNKVKYGLTEIKWTSIFELVVALFWTNFLVNQISESLYSFKFLIPTIILLGITLFSTILSIRKLTTYYSIKTDETIVKTQSLLLRLRKLEQLDVKSILVIIPLFSAPFFIVIAKAWFDVDLYVYSNALLQYTIGSFVVGVILFFILDKYSYKDIDESLEQLEKFK